MPDLLGFVVLTLGQNVLLACGAQMTGIFDLEPKKLGNKLFARVKPDRFKQRLQLVCILRFAVMFRKRVNSFELTDHRLLNKVRYTFITRFTEIVFELFGAICKRFAQGTEP